LLIGVRDHPGRYLEATQQQQAANQEQLKLFKAGFGACLESKGYTVK